jgi:hypothetical protein
VADDLTITAYQINFRTGMTILPTPLEREWMNATYQEFAYRCLPVNLANQNGWWITNPATFEIFWYGGDAKNDVEIRFQGTAHQYVSSHFGSGILTFLIPYLFRTPEGINLWVKGPTNRPKDGIAPLEGLVETDWSTATFTMNWKITRQNEWIRFDAGEPFCQIVPVPRGLVERFVPRLTMIDNDPQLHASYRHWEASRRGFEAAWMAGDPEARRQSWQKDYVLGKTTEGAVAPSHQMKLVVKPFPLEPEQAPPRG